MKVASPYASVVAAARGIRASREDFARAAAEHIAALADRELEHARAVVAAEREERGSPEEGSPAPGSGARQPTLDGVVAALFAAGSAEAERAEAEEAAAGGGGAGRAPGRGAEAAPALGPGARAADLAARGRDGGEATNAAATSRGRRAAAGGAGAGAPPDAAPRVRTPRASRSAPRAVTRGRG